MFWGGAQTPLIWDQGQFQGECCLKITAASGASTSTDLLKSCSFCINFLVVCWNATFDTFSLSSVDKENCSSNFPVAFLSYFCSLDVGSSLGFFFSVSRMVTFCFPFWLRLRDWSAGPCPPFPCGQFNASQATALGSQKWFWFSAEDVSPAKALLCRQGCHHIVNG